MENEIVTLDKAPDGCYVVISLDWSGQIEAKKLYKYGLRPGNECIKAREFVVADGFPRELSEKEMSIVSVQKADEFRKPRIHG